MTGTIEKTDPIVEIRRLKKYFQVAGGQLHAVDDVTVSIPRGKTLGLVGESGCGKSTLGRVVIGLIGATDGEIFFNGKDSLKYGPSERAQFRKHAQIVFQDPFSSLNPRMTVSQLIAEPMVINRAYSHRSELDHKVKQLMDTVGLAERLTNSFPHELDGGRRQRIGIARALALDPEFIVLDEPVSALDVCIQAQILNLLGELKKERGYTYLFISHNLSVVRYVSDEIAVMYLGQIVEKADNLRLFQDPVHPYTQALLSAIPVARLNRKKKRILLEGDVPSPVNPPQGCRFAGRCAYRQDVCMAQTPELREIEPSHFVACHFARDLRLHA
ncbi:ABC transporter, ATP-binding protein [Pyramidobacter piscolens W5455]|uniref:ABC transporter, ATP-binding protein n=1 Tax=Pyramidobacter piscolens W5455 TaxID=352165 RepID=A0ABM9ZY25_9BACT|nr:oligopeptide/dipeptide ABC transporter ATP-binding protein [Pyramidobacter piscolens]EFB91887.1 ABC transporter, ATP-binding protein [Pyramidobacter piscolens W5455]BDF77426.1 ABC transporter ATP-binding protein [Pyramidobacter piscolens]